MDNSNIPFTDPKFTQDVNKICADYVSTLIDFSRARNLDPIHFVTYVLINMSARQIQFAQFMDNPDFTIDDFMSDVKQAYDLNHQLYNDAWAQYKEHNIN